METIKPNFFFCSRASLLAGICVILPLHAAEPRNAGNLANSEEARRSAHIEEAQILLKKGDDAYQNGRYEEAVEDYASARELIPNAPVSAALREATTERYVQASVEYARALSRKGDVSGAKAAIDKVLSSSVAPNSPEALNFRAQLDDPIRTNPALTKEVTKEIDSVRRLLYTAEGAYNLGKFDEANQRYEDVLRIDPTNSAARRGMERVVQAIHQYQKSAYNQTRSEMLTQVAAQWEHQPPAQDINGLSLNPDEDTHAESNSVSVSSKLDRIIIPKIDLDQVSLEDAIDFLRMRAKENDTTEIDPSKKGLNFTIDLGPPDSPLAKTIRDKRFKLKLENVPVSQVLKYITEATKTSYQTDDYAVMITPEGSGSEEMVSHSYRVPPGFLNSISNGAPASAGTISDPFASDKKPEGLLVKRIGAKEALINQGVSFPNGASVSYIPQSNALLVVNTRSNQEFISRIVKSVSQVEPVLVKVSVTMINVQENRLKELGFDWLLNPVSLDSSNRTFLSGGTPGNSTGRTAADFVSPVNHTTIGGIPANSNGLVTGLLTNGNRSGSTAIDSNSIDGLINNPNRDAQSTLSVAPGILAVTGLFTNGQIQMIMRGLNQQKGVDITAQPSVTTRSGQESSIEILREILYPTAYEPGKVPTTVSLNSAVVATPTMPTDFKKRDVGVQLTVLPKVDVNKQYVDVTLSPIFSALDGFVNYGSPILIPSSSLLGVRAEQILQENKILMPIFSRQSVNTSIDVADGATVALGGLLKDEIQTVEDKTPILGDIPIVGRLFQSSSIQPISTAIIFLVHVEIIDPTGHSYQQK